MTETNVRTKVFYLSDTSLDTLSSRINDLCSGLESGNSYTNASIDVKTTSVVTQWGRVVDGVLGSNTFTETAGEITHVAQINLQYDFTEISS